jgi:hypothetical protein
MAPVSVGSAAASGTMRCAAPGPKRREANHAAPAAAPANGRTPPDAVALSRPSLPPPAPHSKLFFRAAITVSAPRPDNSAR